jgi:hypothetical protein
VGRNRLLNPQGEDVSGGARDLHPGNADEAVLRGEFGRPEAGVDFVVVSHGQRVQADGAGLL